MRKIQKGDIYKCLVDVEEELKHLRRYDSDGSATRKHYYLKPTKDPFPLINADTIFKIDSVLISRTQFGRGVMVFCMTNAQNGLDIPIEVIEHCCRLLTPQDPEYQEWEKELLAGTEH